MSITLSPQDFFSLQKHFQEIYVLEERINASTCQTSTKLDTHQPSPLDLRQARQELERLTQVVNRLCGTQDYNVLPNREEINAETVESRLRHDKETIGTLHRRLTIRSDAVIANLCGETQELRNRLDQLEQTLQQQLKNSIQISQPNRIDRIYALLQPLIFNMQDPSQRLTNSQIQRPPYVESPASVDNRTLILSTIQELEKRRDSFPNKDLMMFILRQLYAHACCVQIDALSRETLGARLVSLEQRLRENEHRSEANSLSFKALDLKLTALEQRLDQLATSSLKRV
ncbi:MAG: hypothetical protein RLZZ453_265 [Chlamydiota bacterium]|jgi:hypothetical protein